MADQEVEVKPSIVAPVSRRIGATDTARSAAFYREVLGFEIHEAPDGTEATGGPVLLHFDAGRSEPAIVFFEVNDVIVMRAAIVARGGQAGEIVKVNWIKMEMFEVRDPAGNALWFGRSYAKLDAPKPPAMFRKALPRLPLTELPAGIAHYRDVLGFQVNYADDQVAVMFRDAVTLLLFVRTPRNQGAGEAYFYIEDADKLWAELRSKGAGVLTDPVSLPWGLREFSVRDLEGNVLYFGQTFE